MVQFLGQTQIRYPTNADHSKQFEKLGDTIGSAVKESRNKRALLEIGTAAQTGDLLGAQRAAFRLGRPDIAMNISNQLHRQKALEAQISHQQAMQGNAAARLGIAQGQLDIARGADARAGQRFAADQAFQRNMLGAFGGQQPGPAQPPDGAANATPPVGLPPLAQAGGMSGMERAALAMAVRKGDAKTALKISEGVESRSKRRGQRESTSNVVVEDIDRSLEKIKGKPYTTTGMGGALLSEIPSTEAHDMSRLLMTVKANAGFDKLQQMRENSPTGGALGQVSNFEVRTLQSLIGNLEQSQSAEQLIYNLRRVKNKYLDIVHGPDGGPAREKLGAPSNLPPPPSGFEVAP